MVSDSRRRTLPQDRLLRVRALGQQARLVAAVQQQPPKRVARVELRARCAAVERAHSMTPLRASHSAPLHAWQEEDALANADACTGAAPCRQGCERPCCWTACVGLREVPRGGSCSDSGVSQATTTHLSFFRGGTPLQAP